jgi:hypothetical protein
MSDALPLPPRPNLEQYKKLARDFQSACKSSEPRAIRDTAAQWVERLFLLRGLQLTSEARTEIDSEADRIERRWERAKNTNERASRCTLTDAQFFVAREHGFASWPKFASHLADLARANSPVSNFENAVEAIISGNVRLLKKTLQDDPGLVWARSTRDHRSTLLHYVSANGVEDFRQKTPENIVEITEMLLDAGAEVDAESDAYGGGSTTLGLVATSIHPEQAGVQLALLQTLLAAGAKMDDPSLITSCLANGQPKAAEFFASLGAPVDLEGAAGIGDLERVKAFFDDAGAPRSPSTRKEMDSAFLYACWYGQKEVIEFLLEGGVDVGLRNDAGQTGLHCVAYGAHTEAATVLLQHGAPVDVKERSFRATPLDVALWVWNETTDGVRRERCYEMITLLSEAGSKLDPQHWTNADGTSLMLDAIRLDARMKAALQGRREVDE